MASRLADVLSAFHIALALCAHIAVPSVLLLVLLVPRGHRCAMVPAAIAGAVGWNFLVAQVLDVFSVPVVHGSASVADLVLLVAVILTRRLRRDSCPQRNNLSRSARGLVLTAVAVAAFLWLSIFLSAGSTPPYQDGVHHGFMVRQLDVHQTADPRVIASLDASGAVTSAHYYPLGIHITTAFVHQTSGARIDQLLAVWVLLASVVVLPIGLAVFAKDLLGRDLAAGVAALAGVLLVEFPYLPYTWGGLPTLVGIAVAPGLALALANAARAPNVPQMAFAALGLVGAFSITNNSVFLPVLLAFCLVLRQPRSLGWPEIRIRVLRITAVGVSALVALTPTLNAARSGFEE